MFIRPRYVLYFGCFRRSQLLQIIVNGLASGVGSRQSELDGIIHDGMLSPYANTVSVTVSHAAGVPAVVVSGPPNSRAVVQLVFYDPSSHDVAIAKGENRGRTIPHRNIVKDIVLLGWWEGGTAEFALPGGFEQTRSRGWDVAILVHKGRGGPIVGAARLN